jgi:hypothetical protein
MGELKMTKPVRLPVRFPDGTKYVLESQGGLVRRYVEFPDGRQVELVSRKAQTCRCLARRELGLDAPAKPARRRKSAQVAA